ncbi:MAG: isomerizing glutamine--fructose-6-phosphate transaminase, partial [Pseudomonadota bacterium]
MCGIVGILGSKPVAHDLVDALRRLEYRGYDSAGIATVENGHLDRRRAEGKLRNLEAKIAEDPLQGRAGIGHTRWATHGRPNETNAHPHMSAKVSVVHNGIIENFRELRDELKEAGHRFTTETDTETVVHLITHYLAAGSSPRDALKAALDRLEGAFALGIVLAGEDNLLMAARRGSPLVVGHGDDEMFIGSDAIALAPFTDTVTYLEEGDWAVIRRCGAEIFDEAGRAVTRDPVKSAANAMLVDKGNHRHFMLKEIHEQPEVISHTLSNYIDMARQTVNFPDIGIDLNAISRVTITACGTAFYAGQVAKYWIETLARLPVEIDVASEFR